jgi:hypothetical protein
VSENQCELTCVIGIAMRRTRKNRGRLVLAGALAAAATLPALSGNASGSDSSPVRHSYDGLTVSYPSGWQVVDHAVSLTSQSNSILYAANQAIHFKCVTTDVAGGTRTDCQGPLTRLRTNGVLVQWDLNGEPGWNINEDGALGGRTTIDGLPARVSISLGGTCYAAVHALGTNEFVQKQEAVGSQETINAIVSAREPDNYLTFAACIRGPDLAGLRRSVMESLRSTKISKEL